MGDTCAGLLLGIRLESGVVGRLRLTLGGDLANVVLMELSVITYALPSCCYYIIGIGMFARIIDYILCN